MANKKKFSFLDLDNDDFVQKVYESPRKTMVEKNNENLNLSKLESLKIEKNLMERKIIEQEKFLLNEEKNSKQIAFEKSIEDQAKKIKKIEKESKKNEEKFMFEKKIKGNLGINLEKINRIEEAAVKLKQNYILEKMNSKKTNYEVDKILFISKEDSNFSTFKNMFDKVEKFEIKTNIYLKKDLYEKIIKIHNETGKSRSAIINKMIEIALKSV